MNVNVLYNKIVLLQNALCTLIRVELQVWTRILLKHAAGGLVSRHSVCYVLSACLSHV
jgi:hypothetical protein